MHAQATRLRFSASPPWLHSRQHPPPPNNSFKPTPHRGVNSMLYATLHAVATPLRGGLTQALGGRKALNIWVVRCFGSSTSVGIALRISCRRVSTSFESVERAHTSHALSCSASETVIVAVSFPWLMLSFLTCPAESSRVRAQTTRLRFSASPPWLYPRQHPPPPNNSFKPTLCRGVGHVLYATLAHVRRPDTGRLNSGVMPQ